MDVSVIIPLYKGKSYITKLLNKIEINQQISKKKIEVIFVNDYPDEKIVIDKEYCFYIKVINNEFNQGIHQSRINGLKEANGNYILFFDQDDEIKDHFIKSQLEHIGNTDLCIANGIMESANGNCLIYKNKRSQDYLKKQIGFIKVRDLIVSPGQCLIKKASIPEYWMENTMKVNSADDYFLWLLMIENKCCFSVNYDVLYIHKYTGENVSGNIEQVHKSNREMIDLLIKYCHNVNVHLLKRAITYKYLMKKQGKVIPSIKNIDLFLYNTIYQLLWKGM